MFCFRADAGLSEIAEHAPEALEAVERAIREGTTALGVLELGEAFVTAPRISFDHAVMEHTRRGAVLAAEFDWSDIGDWKAVWEQSPRDAAGVASEGRVHARDVADSYLRSDGRLMCVLGVKGLAVVDTADALLVAPIERSQEIKGLVAELEAGGRRRGPDAGAGASALGLVSDRRSRAAVPGQADRGDAGQAALAAAAPPPRRALGGGARHRRGDARRRRPSRCRRTPPATCRSAAPTG